MRDGPAARGGRPRHLRRRPGSPGRRRQRRATRPRPLPHLGTRGPARPASALLGAAFLLACDAAARALAARADALVVAPTPWGPGNVGCLALAREALSRGQPVFLLGPSPERDFTGGRAWAELQALVGGGAGVVPDVEALLPLLETLAPGSTVPTRP